jgi:sec-independent protein translocase protein TatA
MLPGGWEWILILAAVVLLFGAKKIPELARGMGSGIKEFKKATREEDTEGDESPKKVESGKSDTRT